MSFESVITQAVTNLTNRLNEIVEQARTILQLPDQENLNSGSFIHVSRNGTSEKITVQQILDAALSFRQNQLLSIGEITVDGNDVTIPAGATWVINNIDYSNSGDIEINVPFSEEDNNRTDIIVADQFNNMYRVNGPENEGIFITPNTPINTVLVTTISVTDSTIGTPTPPITLNSPYEIIATSDQEYTLPDGFSVSSININRIPAYASEWNQSGNLLSFTGVTIESGDKITFNR